MFIVLDRFRWRNQEIGVIIDGEQGHVLQTLRHQRGHGIEEGTEFRVILTRDDASFVSLVEDRLDVTDPPIRTDGIGFL